MIWSNSRVVNAGGLITEEGIWFFKEEYRDRWGTDIKYVDRNCFINGFNEATCPFNFELRSMSEPFVSRCCITPCKHLHMPEVKSLDATWCLKYAIRLMGPDDLIEALRLLKIIPIPDPWDGKALALGALEIYGEIEDERWGVVLVSFRFKIL